HRSKNGDAAYLLVHQERNQQRPNHPERHGKQHVVPRVIERLPKQRVAVEHLVEVAETNPFAADPYFVTGEAEHKGGDEWSRDKGQISDEPGAGKKHTVPGLVPAERRLIVVPQLAPCLYGHAVSLLPTSVVSVTLRQNQ